MTTPLAWLIDTNVVSEMMRPRPEPRVAAFLDSIADEGLGLATITVWEVLDGIGRLPLGGRRIHLATRFHDLLDELFEGRIVDWSLADARVCDQIMEENAVVVSRSTIMFPTRFSRQRPPPAALQSLREMRVSSAIPASRSSIRGRSRSDQFRPEGRTEPDEFRRTETPLTRIPSRNRLAPQPYPPRGDAGSMLP